MSWKDGGRRECNNYSQQHWLGLGLAWGAHLSSEALGQSKERAAALLWRSSSFPPSSLRCGQKEFLGPGSKSEIRFGTEFLPPFAMPEPSWKPWASVKCHLLLALSDVLGAAPGCRPRLSTEAGGILAGAGVRTSWKMQGRAHRSSFWWTQKNKAEQISASGSFAFWANA